MEKDLRCVTGGWDLPTVLPGTKARVCSTPTDAPILNFSPNNFLCQLPFLCSCQCCWILSGTALGKGELEGPGWGAVLMSFAGSSFPPCKSFLLRILLSGEGRISSEVATPFMRRGEMSCPVPLAALHCDFCRTLGGCHCDVGCAIRRFVTSFPASHPDRWREMIPCRHIISIADELTSSSSSTSFVFE